MRFFPYLAAALMISACSGTTPSDSQDYIFGKTIIQSAGAPSSVGACSQAVYVGETLYISGQLPIDPETGTMPETIKDQTRQCLRNIGAILKEASLDYPDIVKATVNLTDIDKYSEMDAAYAEFFTRDMPSRACCEVSALPEGADVQIDVIAVYTSKTPVDMAGE